MFIRLNLTVPCYGQNQFYAMRFIHAFYVQMCRVTNAIFSIYVQMCRVTNAILSF